MKDCDFNIDIKYKISSNIDNGIATNTNFDNERVIDNEIVISGGGKPNKKY